MTPVLPPTRLKSVSPKLPALLLATAVITACGEPKLLVGAMECSAPEPMEVYYGPVDEPWSTSFENGFCDYAHARGRCYGDERTTRELVTSPTHSGRRAAAYTINAEEGVDGGKQSRCYLEGATPADAIYGAWFYLPAGATEVDNWNLVHVVAGSGPEPNASAGVWDISLEIRDGVLSLYVRDFLNAQAWKRAEETVPVPIGAWFHVEFRWRKAADETGIMELFQDGQLLWREDERITTDEPWTQWYVGNLAQALTPINSTIYVDDVTIRPAPP